MLPDPSTALAIIPLLVDLVSQRNKKNRPKLPII
jgi:hypothetical protein